VRFRVTVRDASIELRGYIDGEDVLRTVADDMVPTLVIASPADDDYNPFKEQESRELHHFETEQENARLEAENAKLVATLEAVRAARSNHPECDVHKEDDPVTCGWKRAVQEIDRALVRTA
jgi:hypothetical protein